MIKSLIKDNKKIFSTSHNKLIIVLVLFAVMVAATPGYFFFHLEIINPIKEKIIDREFHSDIKQFPDIKIAKFMLWEGDSMVTLDIPNKGRVSFWYGVDRIPRIESIGKYYTNNFTCFKIDNNGKKVNYAYNVGLDLDSQTKEFRKWFPFQVNSIKDLINNYTNIVKILETFPQNPPLIDFNGDSGNRKIRKNPDENFMIKNPYGSKQVVCDLYFLSY